MAAPDVGPAPYCPKCGAPSPAVVAVPSVGVGACRGCGAVVVAVRLPDRSPAPFYEALSELDPRAAAARVALAAPGR